MSEKKKSANIDQLMAEADELIRQINSDVINDMKEKDRLKFEKHAQNFKNIKSELTDQDSGQKKQSSRLTSSAEGMHEAFEDIIKAMKELKNKVFKF